MYHGKTIALLLPARNEAITLPDVLRAVPHQVDRVLVLDNGSTDETAQVARQYGAHVVPEFRPGYGRACLAGLMALKEKPPDVLAFADADGSDDLARLPDLIDPLIRGEADLALAHRVPAHPDAISLQQRLGNWFATRLIRFLWGYDYSDLGPMRVIHWAALSDLEMSDPDYGWTVEMQIKALKKGLRVKEYAMPYRRRAGGRSKVSRTLIGTLRAGMKIFWVIGREAVRTKPSRIGK